MKLSLGYSDFKEVIAANCRLVDKSLLIQAVLDEDAKNFLITRPGSFAKTFIMSMLYYFFAVREKEKHKPLFHNLNIAAAKTNEGVSCMEYQGSHPVIFLTLKDVRAKTNESATIMIARLMRDIYQQHNYLIKSDKLTAKDKTTYQSILDQSASKETLQLSLYSLSEYLSQHHAKKVLLLLDDYDTPFYSAYTSFNSDFYHEFSEFMTVFLGKALQENPYVWKALMTGVLDISLTNLFGGENGISVYSSLTPFYADYFGFTEQDVNSLLEDFELESKSTAIKQWYNGYKVADTTLYNPWSIMQCIKNHGRVGPYWKISTENRFLGQSAAQLSTEMLGKLKNLLEGESVEVKLKEQVDFKDTVHSEEVWLGMLWAIGYLTVLNTRLVDNEYVYEVAIPNKEVEQAYKEMIACWFKKSVDYNQLLPTYLLKKDIKSFTLSLRSYLKESGSDFDEGRRISYKFYQVMVLGMCIWLQDKYIIKSNQGADVDSYDIVLLPRSKQSNLTALFFEFKVCRLEDNLDGVARSVSEQMLNESLRAELVQNGVTQSIHIGIAFYRKNLGLSFQHYDYKKPEGAKVVAKVVERRLQQYFAGKGELAIPCTPFLSSPGQKDFAARDEMRDNIECTPFLSSSSQKGFATRNEMRDNIECTPFSSSSSQKGFAVRDGVSDNQCTPVLSKVYTHHLRTIPVVGEESPPSKRQKLVQAKTNNSCSSPASSCS